MSEAALIPQVNPMPEVSEPNQQTEPTLAPTPTPEKELDSARWAALAKKEQRIVHQQQEMIKLQKELSEERKKYQEKQELRKSDKIAWLKAEGFNETEIFNWLAENQPRELTPDEKAEAAAQRKIDEFKKEQEDKQTLAQKQQEQEVLTRFKGRIKGFLDTNKDKYEHCAYHGAVAEDLAYKTIEQIAKDTGEVISLEEAFQALEDFYDEDKKERDKLKKFQKIDGIIQEVVEEPPKPAVSRGTPKTLTNAASPTLASQVKRRETRSEKRERLINQIKQTGLTR